MWKIERYFSVIFMWASDNTIFPCNHTVSVYARNVRTHRYVRIINPSHYPSISLYNPQSENQAVLSQGTFIHSFIPTAAAAATAGDWSSTLTNMFSVMKV